MHPKTATKTKEITKLVLDLVANGLMTYMAFGSPRSLGKYERILEKSGEYAASRIRETLKRLRMQNMIKYNEKDVRSPIVLTKKGLARLAKYKFRDIFKKKKKWDYFWRIVFFDIPEAKKHIREQLRKELVGAGFYPFQRSVYVCPFDCEGAIMDLCKIYRISHNVLFCITPSLGIKEDEVKNFFFSKSFNSIL